MEVSGGLVEDQMLGWNVHCKQEEEKGAVGEKKRISCTRPRGGKGVKRRGKSKVNGTCCGKVVRDRGGKNSLHNWV